MKNKSEKLARNAIRARKAKNKCANEQDKPKKGKRWLIRLGALMGCLLLVSALVVPCFADYPYYPQYTITDDYYNAFLQYDVSDIVQDSDVFMDLVGYYRRGDHSNGWKGLFANHLLCYSNNSFHDDTVRSVDARLSEDSVLYGEVIVEHIVLEIKARDFVGDPYHYAFNNGKFTYDIVGNGDDVYLNVYFKSEFDLNVFELVITAYDYTYSIDEPIEFEGGSYIYEIYENDVLKHRAPLGTLEVAYTVQDSFLGPLTIGSVSLLHDVLFANNIYSFYHPLAFANGYYGGQMENGTYSDGYNAGHSAGYNTGKNEGYVIGHNDGREEGYSTGLEEGYDEGYDEGYEIGFELGWEGGDDAGFERGYNFGINMSDSANLGKNLLGDTLTAPLKALEEFNLVSWRTANGELVEISVMTIISAIVAVGLFFLFIKMFAGG